MRARTHVRLDALVRRTQALAEVRRQQRRLTDENAELRERLRHLELAQAIPPTRYSQRRLSGAA